MHHRQNVPAEQNMFYGVQGNECEAYFAYMPAENGHLYLVPGTMTDDCYGPLPLEEILSPPAPTVWHHNE